MGKHCVKPRRWKNNELGHKGLLPHEALAIAIVQQAVRDTKDCVENRPYYIAQEATGVNKYELLNFFRSKWCGILLGTTELEGEEIIERTGLNELFDTR